MIRRRSSGRRHLAAVLFTDIVGSTERATALGDRGWRDLLRAHHRIVRRHLKQRGGHEIDTAGDGFFATFAQPADAIACALEVADALVPLELEIRAGIHVGELEPMGKKVGGIAVHLAARMLAVAEPGQIVVSSTVRQLASGSDITFRDLGVRPLKGVDEEWHLYEVVRPARAVRTDRVEVDPATRRKSIGRRALAGVGAVALVIGVGVGAYLVARDGRDLAAAATGPNVVREVRSDGSLGRGFRVGRGPSAVIATGGFLWVANSDGGTLSRVDPSSGEDAVIGVRLPMGLASSEGIVWVLDPFANTVSAVTPADARIVDTVAVHGRSIAGSTDAVWLADDVNDVVRRVDPRTRSVVGSLSLASGSGPSALAIGREGLWVVNGLAGTVSRLDPASGKVLVGALGLSHPPTHVAVGGGRVWVLAAGADLLFEIDPASNRVVREQPICDRAAGLAAGAGVVWVACAGDRAVWRLSPGGGKAVVTSVDGVPGGIVVDGDHAWVTVREG